MATETNSVVSYENCCRTCMKEDSFMFDLFTERLEFSNIADMLKSCTKLKIHQDDSLPRQICRYCYNCVISFSHFFNMAQKSEAKLRGALLNTNDSDQDHGGGEYFEVKIENRDDVSLFESQIDENYESCQILDVKKNSEPNNSDASQFNDGIVKKEIKEEKSKLICVYCNKKFSKLSKLELHQQKHLNVDNKRCELCAAIDQSNENMVPLTENNDNSDNSVKNEPNGDSELKCIICSSRFKTMNLLSAHMARHIETDLFTHSNICGRDHKEVTHIHPCSKKSDLQEGPSICEPSQLKKNQKIQCHKCLRSFKNIHALSAHMRKHAEKGRVLSCRVCSKVFKKISHLKRHEAQHDLKCTFIKCSKQKNPGNLCGRDHKEITRIQDVCAISDLQDDPSICETSQLDPKLQCNKCLASFRSINSLSAHMRKHTEKGRVISCKVCKKVFKKISHLKRHEVQHMSCPFKCTVCPKSFRTEDALKDHAIKHRGVKPHRCPVCLKRFSHLSTLTTHIKIHTRDKKFLCATCGKKFDSSTNLNQHTLRHMGLKKFACAMCPKRFVSKGELKSHMVTHTGERSHTCDQCGATFTKGSSLTKHKTRHSGLKPYQCDTCSMRFTCKDHLKRHTRIHTGEKPYKCEICERAFTQSNDLVKHRRAHLGDKVYKCPQCTESFRLHAELRQHISEHYVSSQSTSTNLKGCPKDIDTAIELDKKMTLKDTNEDSNVAEQTKPVDIKS